MEGDIENRLAPSAYRTASKGGKPLTSFDSFFLPFHWPRANHTELQITAYYWRRNTIQLSELCFAANNILLLRK